MAPIIEIKNLTKKYGSRVAVNQLNLAVQDGDIFGFVGPNGAGKTSTIRILCGLLESDGGEAWVDGHSVLKHPRDVRRAIGYMPDFFGVYDDMKVWEYLDFFGACYAIPQAERGPLIDELLELVDLGHRKDDFVDKLSRGMKQRLSIARTLVHDPKILILDEPASGLDPRARVEIRELMLELARMGKTIFFSTHILADVAEICTRVGIIEEGSMVALGGLSELQQLAIPHKQVRLAVLNSAADAEQALQSQASVSQIVVPIGNGADRVRLDFAFAGDDQSLSDLVARLAAGGIRIVELIEQSQDLEAVFLRVTKGIVK